MLARSLLRTIRATLARFLAIFAIIALGVGFFIGLRVTHDAMLKTSNDYLTELLFCDFRLVSTLGFTEEDVEAFRAREDVLLAAGSVSTDALVLMEDGSDVVFRFHTILPDTNRLDLLYGRLPAAADEIVLDSIYADEDAIGSRIEINPHNEEDTLDFFERTSFRVVGVANASYYINFQRGTSSLGSGKPDGFAYVAAGALDQETYTEILLRMRHMPANGSDAYEDAAEAHKQWLEDFVQERGDIRYETLKAEADEKIADAQDEIDDGWVQIADAQDEIADAKKKLADAARDLADAKKELEDAAVELVEAQAELDDARKELDDAAVELADARKELDDGWQEYRDGLAEFEDGKKEYEDGLAEYEEGLAEYEKGLAEYEEGAAEARSQLASGQRRLDAAEAELVKARKDLDDLIDYIAMLKAGLSALDGEELIAAQMKIASMEEQLATGEAGYAYGLAELESGRQAYQEGKREAEAALRHARKQLNEAKEELDDAVQKLSDAKKELEDAQIELDDALAELEDGERKYAEGLAEYQDGLAEYEDGLAKFEDAKIKYQDGQKEYQDGLKKYREKSAEAEDKIANAEKDIAQAELDLTEGQQKIDDAKQDLEDLKRPSTYVLDRDTNPGYNSLKNDTAIVKGISKVFPLFFLLIAVLVCITTMTRMVDERRTEDGTLKALGYSNAAIASRYMIYSASASILGCVAGFFAGSRFMPMAIWTIYRIMYTIDRPIAFVLDWRSFLICTAAYLGASLGSTWFVVHRELQESAAELIRPKAPQIGKRVLLEWVPFIWKRLNFLSKVTIRNIFLYKKRMVMMIIGIGGCTALLLTGFGIRDTIRNIVDYQYDEISLYDGAVTFTDPMDEAAQRAFLESVRASVDRAAFASIETMDIHTHRTEEASVVIFEESLADFIDLHTGKVPLAWPKKGEAVVNLRLARDLELAAGDTIEVTDADMHSLTLTVTGVFDNYLYDYVFISEDTVRDAWGFVPEAKDAYVNFRDGMDVHKGAADLLSEDEVLSVTLAADLRSTIGNLLNSMDIVVLITLVCSAALAFIVLYNLTNISITERRREIATLKVLGFYQGETAQYVFRENLILTGIAAAFGIPMGVALLRYVMAQVTIKQMYFGWRLMPISYALSVALTIVFALLIDLILRRKIDKIDMAESMKAIE